MSRNGTDSHQVSAPATAWFTSTSDAAESISRFQEKDATRTWGPAIVETVGLGAFAMRGGAGVSDISARAARRGGGLLPVDAEMSSAPIRRDIVMDFTGVPTG